MLNTSTSKNLPWPKMFWPRDFWALQWREPQWVVSVPLGQRTVVEQKLRTVADGTKISGLVWSVPGLPEERKRSRCRSLQMILVAEMWVDYQVTWSEISDPSSRPWRSQKREPCWLWARYVLPSAPFLLCTVLSQGLVTWAHTHYHCHKRFDCWEKSFHELSHQKHRWWRNWKPKNCQKDRDLCRPVFPEPGSSCFLGLSLKFLFNPSIFWWKSDTWRQ